MPDFSQIMISSPLIAGAILPAKPGPAAVRAWLDRKKKRLKISDLAWIDALPAGNALAALETTLEHLSKLVPVLAPLDPSMVACDYKNTASCNKRICSICIHALSSVLMISKRCNTHLAALDKQYIHVQKLSPALEQQIWNTVHSYFRYLNRAFQSCIEGYLTDPAETGLQPQHLPVILAHSMENLCNLTLWYNLRYQPPPDGHWKNIHRVYRLAETLKCTGTRIKLHSGHLTTIAERYARALMLDTLSYSEMQKNEIALVDEWLRSWMRDIVISAHFNEAAHLFHVNLSADHGARRVRQFTPDANCRYWETDRIIEGIPNLIKLLRLGDRKLALEILKTVEPARCLVLLDRIYAEWSREAYRRQRRREDRNETMKSAHVAHGIQGCFMMVKDLLSARKNYLPSGREGAQSLDEKLMRHAMMHPADNIALPWLAAEKWRLSDQSALGLGALVDEEIASGLKIGRLAGLVIEDRRDSVTLGVIRNIKTLASGDRHIGIEVISHAAVPVLLSDFSQKAPAPGKDAFGADSELSSLIDDTYGGLLLPENPAAATKPSILIPAATYIQSASLKMKWMEGHEQTIRLGELIEQKDDWVRVGLIRQTG